MSEDCNTTSYSEPRSLPKKPRILRGSQQTANPNTKAMVIFKNFSAFLRVGSQCSSIVLPASFGV